MAKLDVQDAVTGINSNSHAGLRRNASYFDHRHANVAGILEESMEPRVLEGGVVAISAGQLSLTWMLLICSSVQKMC